MQTIVIRYDSGRMAEKQIPAINFDADGLHQVGGRWSSIDGEYVVVAHGVYLL